MFGTKEAPPRVVYVPAKPEKPRMPVLARLSLWLVRSAASMVAVAVTGVGMGVWWVGKQSVQGRHRAKIAPLWVGAAALVPWDYAWWLSAAVLWQVAGGAAGLAGWLAARLNWNPRLLSVRERYLLASGWSTAGLWHALRGVIPAAWWWGAWPVIIVGHAAAWWWGRRVRPDVDNRTDLEIEWADRVTGNADAGPLRGSVLTVDPETGLAHLRAPAGVRDEDVAGADDLATSLLDKHRGAVTISPDPRGSARDFLVASCGRGDSDVIRWWDGDLLDEDGGFPAAVTHTGARIKLYIRRKGLGGCFVVAAGPNRSGKGGVLRLLGVNTALNPLTLALGVDGKRGAGIGYLSRGCRMMATTPEEWDWLTDRWMRLIDVRGKRMGDLNVDRWRVSPWDPQVFTLVDELPEVQRAVKRLAPRLSKLSEVGGSLGVTAAVATQKSGQNEWGTTMARGNMMSNGCSVIFRADDIQMANSATQQWDVDLQRLPTSKGWAYLLDGNDDRPDAQARLMWLPNANDVEDGCDAPHGTVEDWLARTVHPQLRDEESEALGLDEWDRAHSGSGPRIGEAPAPAMAPATVPVVAERVSLTLVPDDVRPLTARERIAAAIPDPPDAASKSDIAHAADVPDGKYAQKILGHMVDLGHVVKIGEGNDTKYRRAS